MENNLPQNKKVFELKYQMITNKNNAIENSFIKAKLILMT